MFLNAFRRLFSNSQNRKARRASGSPRLELLRFEDRITPAVFTYTGGNLLTIDLNNTNELLTLTSSGTGNYVFTSTSNFTGTNAAGLTGNGTTTLTITSTLTLTDVVITDSVASTDVSFGTNTGTYVDNFSITLDVVGVSIFTVAKATAFSGAAGLNVAAARNIEITADLSTVTGNIVLDADNGVQQTGGFYGVFISGSGGVDVTTGGGNITIEGRGGNTGTVNHGVLVQVGAKVQAGNIGTVSVTGTGGASSSNQNFGVLVQNANSIITSSGGNVTVIGTGGGTGASTGDNGVQVGELSQISAGGTGTVSVTGTGGATSGANNHGITLNLEGKITSSGGDITVTGTGGGTGISHGVLLNKYGMISAGGTGTVSVTGTRAAAGRGIDLNSAGASSPTITTNASGATITLTADSMNFGTTSVVSSTGTVTLQNKTAGVAIDLGTETTGQLSLTDTELDRVTAGTLVIGRSGINPGVITVSSALTLPSTVSALQLIGPAGITLNNNVTTTGSQTYTGAVTLGADVAIATTNSNILFSSTLNGAQSLGLTAGAGTVTFTDTVGNSTELSALTISSAADVSIGAAMKVTGAIGITSDSGVNVSLGSATGGLNLSNSELALITAAGSLNITAAGAGTMTVNAVSGGGTISGITTLTAGGTGVTFATAASLFNNALTVASAAIISANITTTGAVSITGAVNLTNGKTIDAGSSTITIDGNDGGAINLTGALTTTNSTSAAIVIKNATTVSLGNITTGATGTVTLGATTSGDELTGAVTQTGVINTGTLIGNTAAAVTLLGDNTLTNLGAFSSVAGGFSLNDLGGLTVTGIVSNTSGAVSIVTTTSPLTISADITATGQSLTLTGVGINQTTGTILAAGLTVNAGAGAIALSQTSNDFTGAVSLTNSGNNNVAITDANALVLGTLSIATGNLTVINTGALNLGKGTVGGNLSATSNNGAITQTAAFTIIGGTSSINAGAAPITLTQALNNFNGAVSLTNTGTNNVAITDRDTLTFGTLSIATGDLSIIMNAGVLILGQGTVGGNLSATSNNGLIYTTGAITITGTSSLNAGTNYISLTNSSNDFVGAVTLNASGHTVQIRDANELTLASPTLGTNTEIKAIAGGTLTLPAFNFSTGTGNIDFQSGTGTLVTNGTLTTSSGTVSLKGTTGVTVGHNITTTSGAISVIGAGINLTSGNTINAGSSTITIDGKDGAITLTGDLTTTNSTSAAIVIKNASTVSLGNITTGGSGTVTLGGASGDNLTGAVTQTGIINTGTLAGNTSSSVTLLGDNTTTNLGTFTSGAGGFSLNDAGGLTVLGTVTNTSGAVSIVTATSPLTISADITATNQSLVLTGVGINQTTGTILAGAATVNAGAGVITLTTATNNFTGTVNLTNTGAFDVAIRDVNALVLGTVSMDTAVAGALTVTSVGLTQAVATTITTGTGALTINAGAGVITLTNSNDFNGVVTLNSTGATVAITDANALTLAIPTLGANTEIQTIAGTTLTLPSFSFSTGTGNIDFQSLSGTLATNGTLTTSSGTVSLRGSAGVTLGHSITTTSGAVSITGAVTLAANSSVATTGSASAGANITFFAGISGAFNLGLNAGTVGAITGTTVAINDLTISNSGSTTFQSAVDAATTTITNTTGTVAFQGNLTLGTALVTTAQAYNVSIIGTSNNIAGATSFLNTGTVTLGNGTNDSITFAGGLVITDPSSIAIQGTVATTNTAMTLGDANTGIILGANTTLNAGSGNILLPGLVSSSGTFSLTPITSGAGLTTISGANSNTTTNVTTGVVQINNSTASTTNYAVSGGTLKGTGAIGNLIGTGTGIIAPGNSPGQVTTTNLNLSSGNTLQIEIQGASASPSAGTDYDQIVVSSGGTVNLNNTILTLSTTYTGIAGTVFTIIDNQGASAVTGNFNGLIEGTIISANGKDYQISYVGGTGSPGNDVTLTVVAPIPLQAGTPSLAAASDTGSSSTDNITAIETPTFNGTGTPGDTVSLFVDGVLAGVGVVDSNGNYSITASILIADGVHAITSQYTNIAGISGAVSAPLSLTVDSTPPTTPTTSADMTSATDTGHFNADNLTSDTTPDFSGSGLTPGNTVVLYVDGQPAGTAVVAANGNWTVTVSPALSDGSHTVTYLVNDPAGNTSGFATTMNITVDTAVPAKPPVPTLDPTSDTGLSLTDSITRDNTPTINGTGGTPGFDVILKDGNGNIIGTAIVAADGTWSITPTSSLADGTYNFTASYTSISGVAGPASDPIRVVIDTAVSSAPAAPTISLINPSASTGHTNSTTPVFEGTGLTTGNLVELFDGSTKVGSAIVDASGNYQIISSPLADGLHSFTVKVTDAAGNTSVASSSTSLTIDTRVPGSPTTPDLTPATDTGASNSDNITNNNTPVFRGGVDLTLPANVGDFVEIYSGNTLVGVGVVVSNNGVLEWSVSVGTIASGYIANSLGATTLSDGTKAISAKFRIPAGTASASSQALTVVVDRTVPAAPSGAPDLAASSNTGNSSTDNLTNDITPTFTGAGGVPGDTVNLYANGTLVGTAIVAPDGSFSVSASPALTDGTYPFTTKYADPAGNLSSASSPINVTIDSTPPTVPPIPDLIATDDTGASNFDNLTSVNQPTFEGFGTTGDTIKIYVGGVLAGTTIVDANGNWSITTNSIADGVHQITSVAIDPAGNASAQSAPLVLTIDSSAPNSPIFTTTSGPTSNAQPPISGTGEPGSTITLYDGTIPIRAAIVNANGTWNITLSSPLADGTHTFTTTATDGAGNTSLPSSPIAVTIDTINPSLPVIASVSEDTGANTSDKITSDKTLTITGTAEPGTTVTVYDNGSPVGTVVVGANGTYSVTTSDLSDGSHLLSITSTDAAGNESRHAAVGTYTIDTGRPTAPTFGSVSQDTGASTTDKITSDPTFTIIGATGIAEVGSTINVYDTSSGAPVLVGTATVIAGGSYIVTTSVLVDGNHPLYITSTDTAGNESLPTSLGTWTIDTAAPSAPAFGSVTQNTGASTTDKITSDNTLTITGTAEPSTTITVYDNGVSVGTAIVAANGSYSVTTSILSDGNHPLSITATDAAGNESSPTSLGTWTIDTLAPTSPVVTSVSDDNNRSNSDKITSDNTLTVTGTTEPNSLITIYGYIHNSATNTDTTRVVVGTGYADANGNYAVITNTLADNILNEKYVLSVTATDVAGKESTATSIGVWAISTSIPNPPVVTSVSQDTGFSSTDKLTNDTTLTVTGTGTPGTTITIYDGNTLVGTGLVDSNGNYAVTTSALSNGLHTLSASATNPFGFEGISTQLGNWTIDTVAPIQPTLTANNGLPLVSGLANSAEPGSTVSVVIGGATYTALVDGTGAWSINLATAIPASGSAPALATGIFPISVYSTNAAGNSTTPVVSNLVVTIIGQPAPPITSNPSTSDTTPLISGNSEIGSTVTVTLLDANNVVIATYSNVPTNSNGTWALDLQTAIPDSGTTPIPALVNGNNYNLSATATDANNQFTSLVPTTQKLVIDTTAPNRPVITSPAITNDTTPLFTGTAEPGTVIELTIKRANGTSITIYQTVTSPIDPNNPTAPGTWSIDFNQISPSAGFLNDLTDGSYIIEVVAIDAAFNRSPAATPNPFIVDTVASAPPVTTSPSLTNDNTPVLAGTAEPGSTVTVVIDGFTYITTAISPSGSWSVDLATAIPVGGSTPITGLTDGINTFTVTATDPAGNTSAPATQNLRVDTTPPAVPQITSSDKNKYTTPVITGLAEPGSTVAVTINGATFSTIVGPNGSWSFDLSTAIPNGGTIPIALLVDGHSYPISVTVTDAAGNTSAAAIQSLTIDGMAPISPTITSSALTNQLSPTVTGTAEPFSTITLTINGATFTAIVDANGNWTINTATATPTSGTLGTFTDGPYPISVYSTDSTQNQSGTSNQTIAVDRTPPVIVGALASFGGNLNLDESNSNAIVTVNISGIEDGRTVTVTLNGLTYTGTVFNGKVDITIPAAILSNLADGSSQTLTVSATDLAGNAATHRQVPFTVDKAGPARPSFVSITSTSTDPIPADPFTGVVNPTVVISGQAVQTIVIHGPNGIVDPSNYTVVDNNGIYTITFTTNQTSGNYQVNLKDANGNENANGTGAQNFFNIDSIPVLYDMPNKRSTALGSTFGNLGVKNTLNGQTFNVPQQADNTWIDLDGEILTFGLSGSTVVATDISNNPTMIEASVNAASLKLDPRTGAYTYTPVSNTDRLDTFIVTIRDTSGNQTQLKLVFDSRDTLDRDGIGSVSESVLAGLVNQSGNSTNLLGDLNQDGIPDSQQNSVSTLAWRKETDFQTAIDSNTAANTDPTAIICMVVNATAFDPATITTLAQLMGNVDTLAQILQVSVSGLSSVAADASQFYKPWDIMNFSVESLVSTGLNDINDIRDGTQIQVSIDISKANILLGGSGFSLYRKFVSADIINDYANAGITLTDLDGNIITTAGWFDYTQRTPGGDGAIGKDFNNDGKIDAIIITLTDNAFGDNSPIANTVVDPITPTGNFPPAPGGSNPAVPTPPGSNPPSPAPTSFAATGTSTGSVPGTTVNIYPTSSTTPSMVLVPFANWQGEVRIARADINADGNLETIATMGEGGLPILRVFDGATGAQTMEIQVYDRAFTGGIFVAIGDLGNDGILDIVTGAGNSGGPHVKIFNAITGAETSSFMAYDINFRGGVSVAVGDIDGSGFAAIVTGAGQGGGPHVKVFNGTDHSLIKQFMAYASTFTGGVYVAVGDYLSDGKYEIITGAGVGGGPHIKIWDYETLNLDGQTMAFTDFTKPNGQVIDAIFTGGVRVALADANGDNVLDILAGAGPGGGPRVEAFVGFRLELLMDFFSGDKNDGRGVFVSQ